MKKNVSIISNIEMKSVSHQVSSAKQRIITKAVKKAVNEYKEAYRRLAAE
ncbi:MAG: hypothetical protein NUV73_00930 [Candidatus Daviesbacteria bacterium]|nr:hypothetical protein [Candidatus Daviesbacteria bacterium]